MDSKQIKSVGIVVKPGNAEASRTAAELSAWLKSHGMGQACKPVSSGEIHGDNAPSMNAD